MTKNILIIGSGGREHALAWKVKQSPLCGNLYVAPGNAGTATIAENVSLSAENTAALLAFALANDIDLTIVGPEVPLANGIVDMFRASELPIFGPTKAAAQLEASKAFAKSFMQANGIPTAAFATFTQFERAMAYVRSFSAETSLVVKASGLAAGKGVIMCHNRAEAEQAIAAIMQDAAFGSAGDAIVIEEWLQGDEISLLAFSDGKTVVPLAPARDHKRVNDGDQGLNTGGMGAYAPLPDVDEQFVADITATVLQPTIDGMAQRGTPYTGVLFAGLMRTVNGTYVLEFNCRFGDPETQVVLPLLDGDLVAICLACINGTLADVSIAIKSQACATVVMASGGYPQAYKKGVVISGLDSAENGTIFHAGTRSENGQIVTSGGRVLAVTALGDDLPTAVEQAYNGVARIDFENAHYRRDIGR